MTESRRYRHAVIVTSALHLGALAILLLLGRVWFPKISLGKSGGAPPPQEEPIWVDPAIFLPPQPEPQPAPEPEPEPEPPRVSELPVPDLKPPPKKPEPPRPKPKPAPVQTQKAKASSRAQTRKPPPKPAVPSSRSGSKPGPGTGTGASSDRDAAPDDFDMGPYHAMLHDRFHGQWIQPTSIFAQRESFVATLLIRIERDGTISNVSLVQPSGNLLVDQSALEAARKVVRVDPLPAALRQSSYEIRINFELD